MVTQQSYKYFAFISYNSHDTGWGKRLQRKLEHYKMPATLCSRRGWDRKPIKPVFFAPTDIQPGGLTEELQERLRASRNLIVICSPHSAKSKWVGEEIAYFHSLGRTKNIHFFIVDGTPHSGDDGMECFNPIVNELGLPEILGANVHEKVHKLPWLNRERAYVQLVTKLLGVEFDDIWQRHRRMLLRKATLWIVGILMVLGALAGTWRINRSVDVMVRLEEASEANAALPEPGDVVVTMALENEVKTDTVPSLIDKAVFANVPYRFMGKDVHVTAACNDFIQLDTTLELSSVIALKLYRNPDVYGHVRFRLYSADRKPLQGHALSVAGNKVVSDDECYVTLDIPLKDQRTSYAVTSSNHTESAEITMPCGNYEAIILKN